MNVGNSGLWDKIAGSWKQVEGEARKQWGKLTDDDMQQIKGNRDALVGRIQQRYGVAKEDAHRQVDDWVNRLKL